jgi:hypothetical protein
VGETKGVSLYNVQQINGMRELAHMPSHIKLNVFNSDFDQSHGRFMDTAALMKNLDLVITVDT